MAEQEPVELTVVPTEMEAAEVCGYLAEFGIEARYEISSGAGWIEAIEAGAHRILVHADDLERAREALAEAK